MHLTAQLLWLLLMPAVAMACTRHSRLCNLLGAVVLAYLLGMLLPQLPIVLSPELINTVRDLAIPLAIPLLLFNLDAPAWLRQAGPALLGFSLAIVSILIMGLICFFLYADKLSHPAESIGMLTGLYSGGTPNMAVLQLALETPEALFIKINAIDVLFGGAWFLILISVAGRLYGLFLRPYPGDKIAMLAPESISAESTSASTPKRDLVLAFVAAAFIVAISLGLSQWLFSGVNVGFVMLVITALSMAGSRYPRLQHSKHSYAAGYYLVLIFCVAIGASVDLGQLLENPGWIAALVGTMFLGSLLLHAMLAWLFRLDADNTIITITAAIYGPPFIPPVANALHNPALLLSGLTTGLVGYALGSFLGLAVAAGLRLSM